MSKSIMDERKDRMMEKPNATSIGKWKVAYCREGDCDSLVVRDVFEKSKYPLFGIKGILILKSIFFAMLCEMKAFRKQISGSLKYEKKDFINMLNNITANDELMMTTLCDGKEDESRSEFEFESLVKVRFAKEAQYPRFELINLEEKGERKVAKTAIHLFTSDAFKLLKHLQKVHNFSDNVTLVDECTPMKEFDNDDFF